MGVPRELAKQQISSRRQGGDCRGVYRGDGEMKDNDGTTLNDYSRGVLLALTDALTLLSVSGPGATVAAASVPLSEARDSIARGKRDGWQRAALIIRAAQASELIGEIRSGAKHPPHARGTL